MRQLIELTPPDVQAAVAEHIQRVLGITVDPNSAKLEIDIDSYEIPFFNRAVIELPVVPPTEP